MKQLSIFLLFFFFSELLFAIDIHKASEKGNIQSILKFINAGGDVNLKDKDGNTPLHEASRDGKTKVISMLLKNKANVNAKDKDGKTPLHEASSSGKNKSYLNPLKKQSKYEC